MTEPQPRRRLPEGAWSAIAGLLGVVIGLLGGAWTNQQSLQHDAVQQAANRLSNTRQTAYVQFDRLANEAVEQADPIVLKPGGLPVALGGSFLGAGLLPTEDEIQRVAEQLKGTKKAMDAVLPTITLFADSHTKTAANRVQHDLSEIVSDLDTRSLPLVSDSDRRHYLGDAAARAAALSKLVTAFESDAAASL